MPMLPATLANTSHLTFRALNMHDFAHDVQRIKAIYNAAWQEN
jgi:hypothetical protein